MSERKRRIERVMERNRVCGRKRKGERKRDLGRERQIETNNTASNTSLKHF